MSSKRTLLIGLGIGILIGVGIPLALIFGGFLNPDPSPAPPAKPTAETPAPDTDIPWDHRAPSRRIDGACRFFGTVTDGAGAPIAGATVRVRLLDEPWVSANVNRSATTAADGTWTLEGLTEQAQWQIFVYAPGKRVASMESPACGSSVDLAMEPGAALLLSFVDANGSPLPFTAVEIAGSTLWPARDLQTDAEGVLDIFGLAPGAYSFSAYKGDLVFYLLEPLELAAGDEIEMEARLDRIPGSLVEVTRADDGRPIAGAMVNVKPETAALLSRTFATDAAGQVHLPGNSPLGSLVRVSAPGFAPSPGAIVKPGAQHRVQMQFGLTLKGTVQNEKGAVISDARIDVETLEGAPFPAGDERVFLEAHSMALKDGWPRGIHIDADTCVLGPPQIPMPAGGGTPSVPGSPNAPTDGNGAFILDGLTPGRYRLTARHPEFVTRTPAEVTLDAAGNLQGVPIIRMQTGALLAIRALAPGAQTLPQARVTVFADDGRILTSGDCSADGIATFKGLPGSFRVEVAADGFVPGSRALRGRPGKTTEASLLLTPADRLLRGRVVDHLGRPVPGAAVRAQTSIRGTVHALTATSAEDGSFAMEGASASTYQMEVEVNGEVRARLAEAATDADVTLMLDPGDAPVSATAPTGNTPVPLVEPGGMAAGGANEGPADDGRGDNLGVLNGSSPVTGSYTVGGSVQTKFGEADQLVVTAPPAGKGGLPISISGGPDNVIINGVQGGSNVSGAGLRAGAKLLKVDGVPIRNPAQARAAINGRIGSVVMLDVLQDGEPLSVVVQRVRLE